MSRSTLFSLLFAGLFAIWFVAFSSKPDHWAVTVGSYVFGAFFALLAAVLGFAVILWGLKALGVIAALPWILERTLNGKE